MDPYMAGMGIWFWAMVILYFVSRKKGGGWTTAFRISAWVFGLGVWYYMIGRFSPSIYLSSLIVTAIVCFIRRKKSEVWKVGFWVSLIYAIPNVIGLLLAISGG